MTTEKMPPIKRSRCCERGLLCPSFLDPEKFNGEAERETERTQQSWHWVYS